MVRRPNLLITLSAALLLASVSTSGAVAVEVGHCTSSQQKLGECSTTGSSDGSGVDVTGTVSKDRPGSGENAGGAGKAGRPLTDAELTALFDDLCVGNGHCDAQALAALNPRLPVTPPGNGDPAAPAAAITIRDLARFLPAAAALHAEPDGWAVVGVPANFYADVRAVTVSGSLLGETAQVRFTPEAYRFDYGDGAVRTSGSAGSSWAALGQEELTETPTSHTYTARGARAASVTVVYAAEYRFADGPWIAVAGAVSGTTPPQRVLVVVERTALTTPA
jgi:hypothetical protein